MAISVQLAYETTGVVNFATGQLVMIGAVVGASFALLGKFGAGEIYVLTLASMALIGLVFAATVYWPLMWLGSWTASVRLDDLPAASPPKLV